MVCENEGVEHLASQVELELIEQDEAIGLCWFRPLHDHRVL